MSFEDDVYSDLGEIVEGEFSRSIIFKINQKTVTQNAIFDKTYLEIDASGMPVQSNAPALGVDIQALDTALGEQFTEGPASFATDTTTGITYKVHLVRRDGTGYAQTLLTNPTSEIG